MADYDGRSALHLAVCGGMSLTLAIHRSLCL